MSAQTKQPVKQAAVDTHESPAGSSALFTHLSDAGCFRPRRTYSALRSWVRAARPPASRRIRWRRWAQRRRRPVLTQTDWLLAAAVAAASVVGAAFAAGERPVAASAAGETVVAAASAVAGCLAAASAVAGLPAAAFVVAVLPAAASAAGAASVAGVRPAAASLAGGTGAVRQRWAPAIAAAAPFWRSASSSSP